MVIQKSTTQHSIGLYSSHYNDWRCVNWDPKLVLDVKISFWRRWDVSMMSFGRHVPATPQTICLQSISKSVCAAIRLISSRRTHDVKWRRIHVVLTSMRRDDVASTSTQRHFGTICPLGLHFHLLFSFLWCDPCPQRIFLQNYFIFSPWFIENLYTREDYGRVWSDCMSV